MIKTVEQRRAERAKHEAEAANAATDRLSRENGKAREFAADWTRVYHGGAEITVQKNKIRVKALTTQQWADVEITEKSTDDFRYHIDIKGGTQELYDQVYGRSGSRTDLSEDEMLDTIDRFLSA